MAPKSRVLVLSVVGLVRRGVVVVVSIAGILVPIVTPTRLVSMGSVAGLCGGVVLVCAAVVHVIIVVAQPIGAVFRFFSLEILSAVGFLF
jgi:hypothetical protein